MPRFSAQSVAGPSMRTAEMLPRDRCQRPLNLPSVLYCAATQSQNRERQRLGRNACTMVLFFPISPDFVVIGVVEHLGNDPVATAPGSDFV